MAHEHETRIQTLESQIDQIVKYQTDTFNLIVTTNKRIDNLVSALDKALEVLSESFENDRRTARGLHERGAVYRR